MTPKQEDTSDVPFIPHSTTIGTLYILENATLDTDSARKSITQYLSIFGCILLHTQDSRVTPLELILRCSFNQMYLVQNMRKSIIGQLSRALILHQQA